MLTAALIAILSVMSPPEPATAAPKPNACVPPSNALGLGTLGELTRKPGNVFISPINITHALALARTGAQGATRGAFDRAMGLDAVNGADEKLAALLTGPIFAPTAQDGTFALTAEGRLWHSPDARIFPEALERTRTLRSSAQALSFSDKPAAARLVNQWVNDATGKMIPSLIEPSNVPDAGMIITSAVYFRADWREKFLHMWTEPRDFTTEGGATVKVPTMFKIDGMSFAQNDLMQSLRLDYVGDAHMLVVLPRPGKMDQVLRTLDLSAVDGSLKVAQVSLKLPKVDIAMNRSLKPALEKLGLAGAFDPALADFTGFTALKPTYISDVRHASALRINEERTEASAATSVELMAGSPGSPDEPIAMTVDRPFLVVIRHTSTGAVLFVGKVADPRG